MDKQTIHTILDQFRDEARSNRDLGDRFERLIHRYFELDPIYADLFSRVWMWNDWPLRGNVPDVGIDLVAQERATGEYCAIQCKFYLPDHTLVKEDIDSFFTAIGKKHFTSGMIVSTTDRWSKHAEQALSYQSKPISRLRVQDLDASPIDWSKFSLKRPQDLGLQPRHPIKEHQTNALRDVLAGFSTSDRGKLIMACGTGKTFTSLCIAEQLCPTGHVLFLVPSLSLLSQSLREWTAHASEPIHSLAVCSDSNIGKKRTKDADDADITLHDLAFPATTSASQIVKQYRAIRNAMTDDPDRMKVVFSTYQSIDAVADAQKRGLPDFDLIICDEAHRTTGVMLAGEDESHFVKVHDVNFIKGKKRLYMTATPRIYGDAAKSKAKEAAAELASMDDPAMFGEELHRLGFGEAVGQSLLSDYKVLVLAVDEKYIAKTFQKQIADKNSELNLDDAVKITGCWNGLEKRFEASTTTADLQGDVQPMRRAVAFSRTIKDSKAFVQKFHQIVEAYKENNPDIDTLLDIEADHVDGTFNALRRGELLDWLKAESSSNTCRILSNVRCLSEGVDVPALDSVIFLNPRNSVIDVVQSVGRVMRRAGGKRYGYIILPIGIPADMKPEDALKDNEKYKVVWQVLQAIRAHDDRFNATINQIELNKHRPDNIQVIGVSGVSDDGDGDSTSDGDSKPNLRKIQGVFAFPQLEAWKDAIYARMVLRCGDRAYWETWARDIAAIAERHITHIKALLDDPNAEHAQAFSEFLAGIQANLNPAVTKDDAVEMLAQHLITKPVFDALFANYTFTDANPVSQSMQRMLDLLQEQAIDKDAAILDKFYTSVRDRAKGLDNAEARQSVVIELYEEFFKNAFRRMTDRLGIVYTPVEVVDFIVHSVENILRDEFQSGLGHKDVHILDPFTGTGTFIVRLLQSGLIPPGKLPYKYAHELHANEIVLLAYYIAAINIEEAYHGMRQQAKATEGDVRYEPFDGIVLTDTFQLYEPRGEVIEKAFPENNKRVRSQKQSPIRVVISNPPYSAQQGSENDNNQNLAYPHLDQRIRSTYADMSNAKLLKNLYDSYVRAIRWASDRIEKRGIIGFVTNGSFIDANNMDGLRACLADEFSSIYVFNLRGNARTQGEDRKKEKGNVFGGGTRTPVAITLLVKDSTKSGRCTLYYHDIGDYLSRDDKLSVIRQFGSISGIRKAKKWQRIVPNAANDWINQRDPAFDAFIPLGDKDDAAGIRFFNNYSQGLLTSRDKWCYNFSSKCTASNMREMVEFYNVQVDRASSIVANSPKSQALAVFEQEIDNDPKKISWSSNLKRDGVRGKKYAFNGDAVVTGLYRPFCKQACYFSRDFNERVYQLPNIFPEERVPNVAIFVTGAGAAKDFSALMTNCVPNFHFQDTGQCFSRYLYEKVKKTGKLDFEVGDGEVIHGYRRRDAITDATLSAFREAYGTTVTNEDVFFYIYGILHSPEYRTRFASDLRKMLPRIPTTDNVEDFWSFSKAGRKLADLHLNYETVSPYPVREHRSTLAFDDETDLLVQKMTFGKRDRQIDKTTIVYNSHITISGIPVEAYDYVVNGKSAIEWIKEKYQVARDKASGIVNDPNDWGREHGNPRYILDLLKRVITVSVETMKIVNSLPPINES